MAITHGKGIHKADSGKGGSAEKKSTMVENEKTHHSEHQPTPPKASLEQLQKGCGCPRKVTAVDVPTNDENQDPAPIEDLPHKHVQNDAEPANEVNNQWEAKYSKADYAGIPLVPCQQCKTGDTQKVAIVPPQDPLSDHTGHNVHPDPKKAIQHSHQEVEAEWEAKAKAIEEKIQKLETAKHLLAEANTAEDIENDVMDQNPQCLSTAIQKHKCTDVVGDSDDEELFNFKDVDEIIDTSEDEEPVKQKVVSVNLRQKAQKLQLTENISSLRKGVKQWKVQYRMRSRTWWREYMQRKMKGGKAREWKPLFISLLIISYHWFIGHLILVALF